MRRTRTVAHALARSGENPLLPTTLPGHMHARLIALDIDGTLIPPGAGHVALPDADISDSIARLCAAGVVVGFAVILRRRPRSSRPRA